MIKQSIKRRVRKKLSGRIIQLCVYLVVITSTVSVCVPNVHAGFALTSYTFFEDFEHGAVGPWASYPPSQDTAYDPTIRILPLLNEKNVKNRALYREITPNYEIDYKFGVRKLLDMFISDTSVLTFRAYVKSYRGTEGVMVRLGFEDGTMKEQPVSFTGIRTWNECRVDFDNILAEGETKKLTAVAFMAVCPNADPETLLRFGLDDVRITGMRESHWQFSEPRVHRLEEWSDFIASTHFNEGESITISGKPPFRTKKVTVRVTRALTGDDEKSYTMKRTGDQWRLTIPLTGSSSGPGPGIWRATIFSTTKNVDAFSTSFVFLVRCKNAPSGHPSLFYSEGDVERIMAKTASGHMKRVWEAIRNRALKARSEHDINEFNYKFDVFNEVHWLPVFGDFGRELRTPQHFIRDNAVVYGMTGDEEAGKAAKRALLKITEWPAYVPPHILNQGKHSYYITGLFLTDLALGYDLLYDRFTPEERKTVTGSLYSKGIKAVYEEYVKGNWVSSNTSNWICDVTAGSILCSMAIYDDYGAEALEPYLTGSILKLGEIAHDAFDVDGCYGEGFLYYMHTLHGLTKSMAVLERAFDIRFPEKIARSHYFLLYQLDPETKRLYTFGDSYKNLMSFSGDSYLGMGNMAYLLGKYRDPYLKWLYDFNPGTTERDLFFADDSIVSKSPDDLQNVRFFRDIGTTVFRSGFTHDDFVFIFRCGPFVNHQHFDQGGFFLADHGEEFLGEMGRSDYYDDLWYQKLVVQPGGHNCILVDGNPESQRHGDFLHDVPAWKNYALTTDFFTFEGGAFVSGRIDPLYKGKLQYLRRSVVYLEPRTVLLIDEATGTPGVKTINLRFHAPLMENIAIDGCDTRITRPAGTLTIRTAAPAEYRAEVIRRPMTLREISDKRPQNMKKRGFFQLSGNCDSDDGNITFVNVLTTDMDRMKKFDVRRKSDHVVIACGKDDFCINTAQGERYREGSAETDALVFTSKRNVYIALRAQYISKQGLPAVSADRPISLEFRNGTVRTMTYNAADTTILKVNLPSKPEKIFHDGKKLREWKYKAGEGLVIELQPGSGEIEIQ